MISSVITKLTSISLNAEFPPAWLFVTTNVKASISFINEFSQWLLCLNKQNSAACGSCKSCNLFVAQTHPDFLPLTPSADKTTISIDAIRKANDYVTAKPQLSSHKVVFIYPAEAMMVAAANALLKNLEEPRGNTLYILLTKHPDLLLKTIVSRCQLIRIPELNLSPKPSADISVAQIEMPTNIIKQMTVDLSKLWIYKSLTTIQLVEAWLKQWPNEVLYCLDIIVSDVLRFKYTQDCKLAKFWCDEQELFSKQIPASKFWAILERLRVAQYWLGHNQIPNMQLLLEEMLF